MYCDHFGGSVVMNVGKMMKFLIALVATVFATGAFAQSGYQIRTGDTLQIEVLEDPSLNRSVLVLPDGTISLPFAGSIRAAGRTRTARRWQLFRFPGLGGA